MIPEPERPGMVTLMFRLYLNLASAIVGEIADRLKRSHR